MNGPTHRLVAGLALGALAAHVEQRDGIKPTPMPVAAGALGAFCTNLPDWLEPATSPNHRKFFHSLTFAVLVGAALKKAWDWEPETDTDKLLRFAALAATGGYLIHLALDATTKRSLPLI